MASPKERWLPVRGYEGLYSVSDRGRLRSHHNWVDTNPGFAYMRQKTGTAGYHFVALSRRGKIRTTSVHALVLETFRKRRPRGKECDHIDGNPQNNRLDNLEWVTHRENMRRARSRRA